jgi:phosphopantothenoylcysteine synthetase/decarboxylase
MKILVTAGNTQVPIDKVRCITNIFTGRTGAAIALRAHDAGHQVVLVTSHPEAVLDLRAGRPMPTEPWSCRVYRTYDDLSEQLASHVESGRFDVIVHCAAVSDYLSAGIYAPAEHTCFDPATGAWTAANERLAALVDRAAGKVKSDEPELWLRLVRAPKLVDRIRKDWSFAGVLVKFKLEVGISEECLLEVAERSRRQSDADLMVANTLEGAADWAYLGPLEGRYQRISRRELPATLLDAIENCHREKTHG